MYVREYKKNKKESKIAALRLNIKKVILVNIFSFRKFFKGQYANSCFKELFRMNLRAVCLTTEQKKVQRKEKSNEYLLIDLNIIQD